MRRLAIIATAAVLFLSCGDSLQFDAQREWAHVLSRKKAATDPAAPVHVKQAYADSLGAFLTRHPSHYRAREVYRAIQLDFARELSSIGRYQDAIRFYRSVLYRDPANAEAIQGMTDAVERLAISREKLLRLEKGMSQRQVAQLLGRPIPGWRASNRHADSESWYYRTTEGGVAGVYFRDGVLIAAEARSHEKLAPLAQ